MCSPKPSGIKWALNKCLINETINSVHRSISLIFQGHSELSQAYSGLLDLQKLEQMPGLINPYKYLYDYLY